ncbi:MAG: DUF5777 family beta-barrel protein [Bacteroidales bacterium]
MKHLIRFIILFSSLLPTALNSQDLGGLLDELDDDNNGTPEIILGTFEGTTVINGQSVEVPGAGDLNFRISHRFGAINLGIYQFFGMDQASTRLGFDYGIKDLASISIGRNTFEKTYDGAIKYRILKQQNEEGNMPVSLTFYSVVFVKTLRWDHPERDNLFTSRLSYANQLLLARKFGKNFSLQLSPTYVHKNLVPFPDDQNDIFATGISGKIRLNRMLSFTSEYFYLLPGKAADDFYNALALGVDIETGGHIFQLQVSNSQAMFERAFITETSGNWLDGEIFFGFNLYRVFPTGETRRNIKW